MSGPRRRANFRDLPLVWKLLVPYLVLLVVVGSFGAFLVVRDLRSRAQASLDRDLTRRSLDFASFVRERELYMHESANYAANLQGMADVVAREDGPAATKLLGSVLALKTDLNVVIATNRDGAEVAAFSRLDGGPPAPAPGGTASPVPASAVHDALSTGGGVAVAGLFGGDHPVLAVVAPVCAASSECGAAGAAIAGIDAATIATVGLARPTVASAAPKAGIAIFDLQGRRVASAGPLAATSAPSLPGGKLVRRAGRAASQNVTTLYAPLDIDGRRQATVAVTIPTGQTFSSVRAAAWRIALLVLAAIVGVVGIGALLSRYLLAQVQPLLRTNRALGAGDLSARTPVLGDDELGELARGVNQMAEQLQTSYEHLEQRVRDRTAEVEQLLSERTDLFTSISHEFRTPLAIILAQADALLDASYAKTAKWCAEVGRMVDASGRQLLSFINDVLALAAAESEGLHIEAAPVRVSQIVNELRPSVEDLATRAGVALRIRVRRDLTPVMADRLRLGEVILNLIDNAVKYTPRGGSVELAAANGGGHVEITVTDTGIGIPADIGARIFEPFYRVKGNRTQHAEPSSGLGLAVTRRLVEAHGGTISFAANDDDEGGTIFRVTIPSA